MCIVFVGVRAHPRFPVIVAANRDEFVTRETERVHRWAHLPSVVAGRDGVAGGTWMGINPEDGRWASLVNVAPPHGLAVDPSAPSRGVLAQRFLATATPEAPALFAQRMGGDAAVQRMAGHSMVVGDATGRVAYYCNRGGAESKAGSSGCWRECDDGMIYALSNDLATAEHDSCWAKASRGRARMAEVIASGGDRDDMERGLFEMLGDSYKQTASVASHGFQAGGERSGDAFEKYSAAHPERPEIPIFIAPPAPYRTRCSTLLLIDAQRNVHYIERNHDDGSEPSHVAGTRRFFYSADDGAARL